jgi:hypothetical protein
MADIELLEAAAGAARAGVPIKMSHKYKYILNAHGVSDYEENDVKICDKEITIPENIHLQYFIDPFDKVYTVCLQEGDIEKLCAYSWMSNPAYLYTKDSEPKLPNILLGRLDNCEANTGLFDCTNEEWKEAAGLGPIDTLSASDTTPYFSCLSVVIESFSRDFEKSNPGDIAVLYIAVCNKSLTCRNEDALAYYPVGNVLYTKAKWNEEVKKTAELDTAIEGLRTYYTKRGGILRNANRKINALSEDQILNLYKQYLSISKGGTRIKSHGRKTRRKSHSKKKKYTRRRV